MKKFLTLLMVVLAALLLLTSCDFAQPKMEKPAVRLFSVALNYKGMSVGELEATLNDQIAVREQFQFLAKNAGNDYEGYIFEQDGTVEFDFPNKIEINLKTVDGKNQFDSFSIPESTPALKAKAINVTLFKDTEAALATEAEKFPVDCPIPAATTFSFILDGELMKNESGYDYQFSGYQISAMEFDGTSYDEYTAKKAMYNEMLDVYESIIEKKGFKELEEFAGIASGASKTLHDSKGFSSLFLESLEVFSKDNESNDLTVIHYSGHGGAAAGKELNGFLCFGDHDNLYPMTLRAELAGISGKQLVVLDSCYSGGFIDMFNIYDQSMTFTDSINTMLSVQFPAETNTWILSASRNYETSADGGKGNLGFFTGQFVKALGANVGDPIEDTPQDVQEMKELGFCSYVGPGLPDTDSIWLSELLATTRSNMNLLKMEGLQYPMGDSYIDLRLFSGLDK